MAILRGKVYPALLLAVWLPLMLTSLTTSTELIVAERRVGRLERFGERFDTRTKRYASLERVADDRRLDERHRADYTRETAGRRTVPERAERLSLERSTSATQYQQRADFNRRFIAERVSLERSRVRDFRQREAFDRRSVAEQRERVALERIRVDESRQRDSLRQFTREERELLLLERSRIGDVRHYRRAISEQRKRTVLERSRMDPLRQSEDFDRRTVPAQQRVLSSRTSLMRESRQREGLGSRAASEQRERTVLERSRMGDVRHNRRAISDQREQTVLERSRMDPFHHSENLDRRTVPAQHRVLSSKTSLMRVSRQREGLGSRAVSEQRERVLVGRSRVEDSRGRLASTSSERLEARRIASDSKELLSSRRSRMEERRSTLVRRAVSLERQSLPSERRDTERDEESRYRNQRSFSQNRERQSPLTSRREESRNRESSTLERREEVSLERSRMDERLTGEASGRRSVPEQGERSLKDSKMEGSRVIDRRQETERRDTSAHRTVPLISRDARNDVPTKRSITPTARQIRVNVPDFNWQFLEKYFVLERSDRRRTVVEKMTQKPVESFFSNEDGWFTSAAVGVFSISALLLQQRNAKIEL